MTETKSFSSSDELSEVQKGGVFQISTLAKNKVDNKRKRRGLGEIKPRQNNPYTQFLEGGSALIVANTLTAPIERCRII